MGWGKECKREREREREREFVSVNKSVCMMSVCEMCAWVHIHMFVA